MDSLALPYSDISELKKIRNPKKKTTIEEAIALPRGTDTANKIYTTLYKNNEYEIKVGKPGKEFNPPKNNKKILEGKNPNDMTPTIFKDENIFSAPASFGEIFKILNEVLPNYEALKILGCLLVRNAFLLDHEPDTNGKSIYSPNKDILTRLKTLIPTINHIPPDVFLHYLDAIALNEDVKYHTLGYRLNDNTGRTNNLLTYASYIRVLLKKESSSEIHFLNEMADLMYGLTLKRGVHDISIENALESFEFLKPKN